MKRYFTTLWFALTGRNPFRKELDEKSSRLEKEAENVRSLQDQLNSALNYWNEAAKMAEDSRKALSEKSEYLEAERRRVLDLELLVENLRERVNEKDTLMGRMKQDYQQRIAQYMQEIEELQGKKSE